MSATPHGEPVPRRAQCNSRALSLSKGFDKLNQRSRGFDKLSQRSRGFDKLSHESVPTR
jgi:hypothetical protein